MIASRLIAVVSLLLASAVTVAAGQRIADGGAPWCERADLLGPFVRELLLHGALAFDEFPTCVRLKAGVHVKILGEVLDLGQGTTVVATRVFGNGTSADGFTFNKRVEEVP